MKFILPMPPGINRTYGVTRKGKIPFYKKPIVRNWEQEAGWEIKRQWKGRKQPILGDVRIKIVYFYSRNRDWDSSNKVICDLFQRVGFYKDDMQITEAYVSKFQDLKFPRLEVEIKSL